MMPADIAAKISELDKSIRPWPMLVNEASAQFRLLAVQAAQAIRELSGKLEVSELNLATVLETDQHRLAEKNLEALMQRDKEIARLREALYAAFVYLAEHREGKEARHIIYKALSPTVEDLAKAQGVGLLRDAHDLEIPGFENDAVQSAQVITELAGENKRLREALTDIAKGEGPYSQDPLTHAGNVIEAMKALAEEALKK